MRVPDWNTRLAAFILANAKRPHQWGEWDCALFVADTVMEITGVDHAQAFRGRYTTERGAALALRRYGGGGLSEYATKCLGAPIHRAMAWRGDVVLFAGSLGICYGPHAVMVGTGGDRAGQMIDGLIQVPMAGTDAVWPVR